MLCNVFTLKNHNNGYNFTIKGARNKKNSNDFESSEVLKYVALNLDKFGHIFQLFNG
jgi:hypothetical protein